MAGSRALNTRYQIEEPPIGQGGMGVVYKAFDRVTRRFVALKTIKGSVDQASIELFEKEWTILARLCHPNIVDILDIGEFSENGERRPYFVMPLLPGQTLERIIKGSSQRLTPERSIEIIAQACRGLQAAHDKGLIHRDLKPSNLFVMDDDTVKIIDFGVVHLADARTVTGLKGTLQYMAPEQLESKPATTKSDLFSIAVVCYEALTGRRPFARSSEPDVIEAIRSHVPPPASQINSAVSDSISRSVHKAMAKQPYHRFGSVKEFCETLQKASRNEHIELFDGSKIRPRISRTKRALNDGDYQYAMEILNEIESEGHVDPEVSLLRIQVEQAMRARTIRQLLEDARTRMEEEEFPLALQKVQSVLEIDSTNVDALALRGDIERHRSVFQIEKWLSIAQQHLQSQLFPNARRAVEEVLKIDRSYKPARELMSEIDRQEHESTHLRQERNNLYQQALTAYRNGEISSALVKLERVLDLGKKFPGHPQTDANYQAFYNQIRSERDELHNSYSEGRKAIDNHDFSGALKICNEVLSRRPGEPMFKALKLEVEEAERQESSAAIAELHRRVELEPDFDKKLAILKEAVTRFPGEPVFRQASKHVKERRDLVNSIVSRARHYESQEQYYEALGQWDIMRNIYAQYPGLDVEVERLVRRRDEAARNEARAAWVSRIDRALDSGDYSKAGEVVAAALAAFPGDTEFARFQQRTDRASRTLDRSRALLEEGRKLASSGAHLRAIGKLREALELSEHDSEIRAALAEELVTYGRVLLAQDGNSAEPFAEEALAIDPQHAEARKLADEIGRRNHTVLTVSDDSEALRAELERPQFDNAAGKSAPLSVAAAASGIAASHAKAGQPSPSAEPSPRDDTGSSVYSEGSATVLFPSELTQFAGQVRGQETVSRALFGEAVSRSNEPVDPAEAEAFSASAAAPNRADDQQWMPARQRERSYEKSRTSLRRTLTLALGALLVLSVSWLAYNRHLFQSAKPVAPAAAITNTAIAPASPQSAPREQHDSPKPSAAERHDAPVESPSLPASPQPAATERHDAPVETPALPSAADDGKTKRVESNPPAPIEPKLATGIPSMVQFRTSAPQATLKIDNNDDLVCQLPCYLPVMPGQHKLLITAPGYYAAQRIVQIPQDGNPYVTLIQKLTTVHLNSDPEGASVAVDGKDQGQTPVTLKLPSGEHQVRLEKGAWKYEGAIKVEERQAQFFKLTNE